MSSNIYCDAIAIGKSNTLAWELAREVVLRPCGKYNLVYLHGVSGVGKTQMLRAIEHGLREHHPNLKVLFTTADQMTDLLIQDILYKTRSDFEKRYQDTDVLLVDDIQHLAGKETTQETIVKLFDALCARGKQVVIASDRPVCEFVSLNQHLHRRLESTVSAEIREPGSDVRCAIIDQEAKRLELELPKDIREYLAEQAQNPFQLQGFVRQVAACHELQKMPLDTDHVAACLKELLEPRPTNVERVLELVCRYYDAESRVLLGTSRAKGIGEARRILAYLLCRYGKVSIPEIGKMMNRDHTTILQYVKWVEVEKKQGGAITNTMFDLESKITESRGGA